MERLTMKIKGMGCQSCVNKVTGILEGLGQIQIENVAVGTATVEHDPTAVPASQISEAIEKAGYKVIVQEQGVGRQ